MATAFVLAAAYTVLFTFWIFVILRERRERGAKRRNQYYQAVLIDLTRSSKETKELDSFVVHARSYGEAQDIAMKCLKIRWPHGDNSQIANDIRQLISFYEAGGAPYTAGYEFDALPEALRRVHLAIYPQGKTSVP